MTAPLKNIPLEKLISYAAEHPTAGFYRELWGMRRRFGELPIVSRSDLFINTPFSRRRYKDDSSLVKIVHSAEGAFLSEWSFEDIGRESWGDLKPKRPLVYMTDSHEALEKSMWCYENGILPLIGERDPDIVAYTASIYKVNQLITDMSAALKLQPYLKKRAEPLETITFVGKTFDHVALKPFAAYACRIRLVLGLPETGALAVASLERPQFTILPGCIVEEDSGEYIVTKLAFLTTPIIRYRTGIQLEDVSFLRT